MFGGAAGDGLLPGGCGFVSSCEVLVVSWALHVVTVVAFSVLVVAAVSFSCSNSGEHSFLGWGPSAPWTVTRVSCDLFLA